jgi:hypothetical protein
MVSWFDPQNQAGYSLLVVPQNQWEGDEDVGHASRSSGLLHLEAIRIGFPSLASRLAEAGHGWCTWHHCRARVEMKLKTDGSM